MNPVLAKRCEDPRQFDKIRYMVHCLDKQKMTEVILEICTINPYLAVLCYNTAEQDDDLKVAICKQLDKIDNNNYHMAIMLCLAWEAIGQWSYIKRDSKKKRHNKDYVLMELVIKARKKCRNMLKFISPRRKASQRSEFKNYYNGWEQKSIFWIENCFRCFLKNNPERIAYFLKITQTPLSIDNYSDVLLEKGKFKHFGHEKGIFWWLKYIDDTGLFGKLEQLKFNYERDFDYIISVLSKSPNRFKARRLESVIKLIIVGLMQEKISIENAKEAINSLEQNLSTKGKNRQLILDAHLKDDFQSWRLYADMIKHHNTNSIVFSIKYEWWDSEKNGIPPIPSMLDREDFGHFRVWWKCPCGYSWKSPLNSPKLRCKKCGTVLIINLSQK